MAKTLTKFVCAECGAESPRWLGKCPGCGSFGTMLEEAVEAPVKSKSAPRAPSNAPRLTPQKVHEIASAETKRVSSGIPELDTVLGGGIVPASLILIGGDPGIGKSTILTQVAGLLAEEHSVLYVSAEESARQMKLRCDRLGCGGADLSVVNETELEKIEELLISSAYEFAVIDSIQAVYLAGLTSANGSVSQVRECASRLMRVAKSTGVTIFIVGHVTKEGSIAGPKVLEHIMDTVLYFEGDTSSTFKILRAVKNRFGSTNEVAIFEMLDTGIQGVANPSEILLSENRGKSAGAAVTPVIEGSRCMLVEVQALVAPTVFGMPRRTANGIDYNKLALLLAVLEKKAGVNLYNQDAYLNVMSGIRIFEPSVDLAVLAAVLSAFKNQPIDKDTAVFGEVGLTGEVRAVRDAEKRIAECAKLGFQRVLLPNYNLRHLRGGGTDKIELVGLNYVYELNKKLF